ncbi:hydrolase [Halobacteriales archaeon QS_3_64_16]|nr:MAG: hydrolase [Halobacteriales archaeon QS_3_64_16]
MTIRHDDLSVRWLGYATVRIEYDDFVAYLDPGRYGTLTGEWRGTNHPLGTDYDAHDADLVCITHDHHYDSEGIARVASDDATIVLYDAVDPARIDRDVEEIEELPGDVVRIGENEEYALEGSSLGVEIETLPAYNHPDGPNTSGGEPIHPEGFGCGYLLDIAGTRVFWPGDSDVLDAHEGLDISLFLPSISSSFTMDRHDAADLAETLDPDLVLPIHYNTFEELQADSEAFAADVAGRGVPVVLDERN